MYRLEWTGGSNFSELLSPDGQSKTFKVKKNKDYFYLLFYPSFIIHESTICALFMPKCLKQEQRRAEIASPLFSSSSPRGHHFK